MKNEIYFNITDYILFIEKKGFLPTTIKKAFDRIKNIKTKTEETILQARDRFGIDLKGWITFLYDLREYYKQ